MTTAAALAAAMLTVAPTYATHHGRAEMHHIAVQLTAYAKGHAVEPELLAAVAMRESTFRRFARSTFTSKRTGKVGHSLGIMGVKELPGETLDLYDLATNVSAGSKLLAAALKACRGDVAQALTAYHVGRGKGSMNCRRSKYSDEVLEFYEQLVAATAPEGKR